MFQRTHWEELFHQGYTTVSGAIDDKVLRAAQATARALNDNHPDGGWERTRNELWREIRHCPHPDFLAITTGVLHPLACEILETVRPDDRIQFSSTMPGFRTPRAASAGISISTAARGRRSRCSTCFSAWR